MSVKRQRCDKKYYNPQIKTFMPMEKHASKVPIPFAFKLLQDEIILSVEYGLFSNSDGSYIVRHYSKTDGGRFVYWNPLEEVVQCSCQELNFKEFCAGILVEYLMLIIISRYQRNTCRLDGGKKIHCSPDEDCHIENPQQSQTKGRKKGKRLIGGVEAAKKTRYCHVPNLGGTGFKTDGQGSYEVIQLLWSPFAH
ncbi:uncharacterized protein [Nicotiana sylvestris]|uniref:uncharacterized protein n=1 Tax=Nicotiana sylvestris TaxID=4096 RepID=UPI00388C6EEA